MSLSTKEKNVFSYSLRMRKSECFIDRNKHRYSSIEFEYRLWKNAFTIFLRGKINLISRISWNLFKYFEYFCDKFEFSNGAWLFIFYMFLWRRNLLFLYFNILWFIFISLLFLNVVLKIDIIMQFFLNAMSNSEGW